MGRTPSVVIIRHGLPVMSAFGAARFWWAKSSIVCVDGEELETEAVSDLGNYGQMLRLDFVPHGRYREISTNTSASRSI